MKALCAAVATVVVMACTPLTTAQEDDFYTTEDSPHCIARSRIDRTEIIDDQHIAFYMKGRDQVFLNTLRRPCPGLQRDDTLMYRTSTNQLCSVDIITVLDDFGFGFSPGVSCALGSFQPTNKEYLEELKARPKLRGPGGDL